MFDVFRLDCVYHNIACFGLLPREIADIIEYKCWNTKNKQSKSGVFFLPTEFVIKWRLFNMNNFKMCNDKYLKANELETINVFLQ